MTFDIVTIFPAMIEQPLAAGVIGRAIERGHAGREGPRPARLHDRSAPRRGRRAVRRRAGDGAEAGADLPGARRDRGRARDAADGGADVAAGAAVHAGRGAAAERPASTWCCCAGATKGSTIACASGSTEEMSIGDYVLTGGELPALVILDAVARLRAGRGRRRAVGGGGFVQPRAAGFSAVHAAGRKIGATLPRARRAVVGQPRGDSALAQAGSAEPDARTAAGSAGRARRWTKKNERFCAS